MSRRTIAGETTLAGAGLHLGEACVLTFAPAEPGAGIRFRRSDVAGEPVIPAHVSQVTASERRTQIGDGAAAIHTVEHVLAAVGALQLDDLWIVMNGPEPPIMDGSAAPFYDALVAAGVVETSGAPTVLRLAEPVRIIDGESVYEAHPSDALTLDVAIDFAHPVIGRQRGAYVVTPSSFRAELASARTFGFVREIEMLRGKGLIRGASTENAIVMDDAGLVGTTLRWPDEFVRHKAMDCVGDLALAGARVQARIVAVKPSHRGTVTLVRELVRAAGTPPYTKLMQKTMSIEEIMKVLPHRYPFLLVDRIIDVEEKRIVGIKNVTINEPFFQGHFPGLPVMPGVLIIEAMAQVGGMLMMGGMEDADRKVVYFIALDNVRWRKPVKPGDQLRFEVEVMQQRGSVCKMRGVAKVDGELVAEAEMAAMVRDR